MRFEQGQTFVCYGCGLKPEGFPTRQACVVIDSDGASRLYAQCNLGYSACSTAINITATLTLQERLDKAIVPV